MIIENVNINNDIDCEGYEVRLTGYTKCIEEALDMNNFIGEDLCFSDAESFEEIRPEPIFGGAYYCPCCGDLIYIKKVIYNKPAVIVIWSDNTKTRSTCDKDDIWNPELGLMLCVMKKMQGQEFVSKLFRDWAIEVSGSELATEEKPIPKTITLKDVRRNLKDFKDAKEFEEKVTNN